MADVADTLIQEGFKAQTGEVQQQSADAVMGLVGKIQQVQTQRAQLEDMKQKMADAKMNKFLDALEKGKHFEGVARNNYYTKFMTRLRDSLGLTDQFPDESLNFATSNDSNINRMSYILSGMRSGKMDTAKALEIINDPSQLALIPGYQPGMFSTPITKEESEAMGKAEEFALTESGKIQRNQSTTQAAQHRLDTNIAATPYKAAVNDASDNFKLYDSGGQGAGINANIEALEGVISDLKTGKVKTRTVGTWVPGDTAKKAFVEEAVSARAAAHKAIQASLRATLGSAFTEEEGKRILENTFDIQLSPKENIKRLEAEIKKIKETKKTAEAAFRRYGFMPPKAGDQGAAPGEQGGQPAPAQPAAQSGTPVDLVARLKANPHLVNEFRKQAEARGMSPADIAVIIKKAGVK